MVLNDFDQSTLPMKLMTSMFQNLFPAINIQKVYISVKICFMKVLALQYVPMVIHVTESVRYVENVIVKCLVHALKFYQLHCFSLFLDQTGRNPSLCVG